MGKRSVSGKKPPAQPVDEVLAALDFSLDDGQPHGIKIDTLVTELRRAAFGTIGQIEAELDTFALAHPKTAKELVAAIRSLAHAGQIRLHKELTKIDLYSQRAQIVQRSNASKGRLGLSKKRLDVAIKAVAKSAYAAAQSPSARGWKSALAKELGAASWRTVALQLPGWGLTEHDVKSQLERWKP